MPVDGEWPVEVVHNSDRIEVIYERDRDVRLVGTVSGNQVRLTHPTIMGEGAFRGTISDDGNRIEGRVDCNGTCGDSEAEMRLRRISGSTQ